MMVFFGGVMVGFLIGFAVCALFVASSSLDDEYDEFVKGEQDERKGH